MATSNIEKSQRTSSSITNSTITSLSTTDGEIDQNVDNADKTTIDDLSKNMIESVGKYIKSEIDICIADYKMLETMNRTVIDKYKSLTVNSTKITEEMSKLNEAYTALTPMLAQIDNVEKCVKDLEQAANKLDTYSKRLENRYKQYSQ
jgi:biogenesis of lysosome-related organelles complex 1 subunit 2